MTAEDLLQSPFATLPELIAAHARAQPDHTAVADAQGTLDYRAFDEALDRVAAALQRDGFETGGVAAICAAASTAYAAAFLGVLRAGGTVAPLAPSSTPQSLARMVQDCGARVLFLDEAVGTALGAQPGLPPRVALDGSAAGVTLEAWLAEPGVRPKSVSVTPEQAFNIIYSSGTTGEPKGIVQPNILRWSQFHRTAYTADAVTLVATPLYSNTTLVSFLPTLANGGTVVLLPKFDAREFLELSQRHRVTHAMLVPVQYRRLMQHPDFDTFDLSSYQTKFSTSAPFPAELKADVLERWPGGLVEFYGMTEGGGSCMLLAHENRDKLATVGRPIEGHDIRLIDEEGREAALGQAGRWWAARRP